MRLHRFHTLVPVFIGAALYLSGCASPSEPKGSVPTTAERIDAPPVAEGVIGETTFNGARVPIFDARSVRCDMSVPPVFPPDAKRRGIQGIAVVRIVVDQRGTAIDYSVVKSLPNPQFGEAALAAARRWRFYSMRGEDGMPMVHVLEMPIVFTLNQS